jgi:hypothetical protein
LESAGQTLIYTPVTVLGSAGKKDINFQQFKMCDTKNLSPNFLAISDQVFTKTDGMSLALLFN